MRRYNLMEEETPKCIVGKEHDWVEIKKPQGNQSGEHIIRCSLCGVEASYDSSD